MYIYNQYCNTCILFTITDAATGFIDCKGDISLCGVNVNGKTACKNDRCEGK